VQVAEASILQRGHDRVFPDQSSEIEASGMMVRQHAHAMNVVEMKELKRDVLLEPRTNTFIMVRIQ